MLDTGFEPCNHSFLLTVSYLDRHGLASSLRSQLATWSPASSSSSSAPWGTCTSLVHFTRTLWPIVSFYHFVSVFLTQQPLESPHYDYYSLSYTATAVLPAGTPFSHQTRQTATVLCPGRGGCGPCQILLCVCVCVRASVSAHCHEAGQCWLANKLAGTRGERERGRGHCIIRITEGGRAPCTFCTTTLHCERRLCLRSSCLCNTHHVWL